MNIYTIQRPAASKKTGLDIGDPNHYTSSLVNLPTDSKRRLVLEAETHQSGQDYTIIDRNIQGDTNQLIVSVFDGHGEKGHIHSYIASRLLVSRLRCLVPIYKLHLKNGLMTGIPQDDKIRELTEYCYLETQELLTSGKFPVIDTTSGTTAAAALILIVKHEGKSHRFLISTNAGDSQIIWSSKPTQYTECSMDHNCDNKDAVQLYANRLAKIRTSVRQQLQQLDGDTSTKNSFLKHDILKQLDTLYPKPVYYSRINCGGPVWDMPGFCDQWGRPQPIPVFKYYGDNYDQVLLDEDNYEKMSQYYPNGTQSRRTPETYCRPDGRIVAVPGQESDNWGSTLQGGCQTINGFGDHVYYPHHSATPHVSVSSINEPGKLIVASDGLTDLFYFQDLMDQFHTITKNKEDVTKELYKLLLETAQQDPNYPYQMDSDGEKWYPQWDDMSGVFISLDGL